ncbi:MAG: malonate decarboxylase subunit alpha [Elusimicrobia bacterium CG03_land_8_20_14_0_80_50_18]|nr:MAG: malonate decarboxylase subunit alpha [Elusimicrobia bacterium CG03_land_8_20_14_0_80_50_18]
MNKKALIKKGRAFLADGGKVLDKSRIKDFLEAVIPSGSRVCMEGDNQKQADFLARAMSSLDASKVNRLHMVQSSVVLSEHLDIFEKGIADKLDFAFSGPQAKRLYRLVDEKKIKIGAIHTYLELYARYFSDLRPHIALVVADYADKDGNLYTGYNTEDTPVICEAASFGGGIVIAQVKEIKDKLPRVDIPGDWVDFVVPTGEDYYIQPLFTRDPAKISDTQILLAMMVIKGIYEKYKVDSLNHGIGYNAAAIELLLPTFAKHLKGKICRYWALNPHPTMIPAIESGFVKSIYSFGGEPGMEDYVKKHAKIFPIGADGTMRSGRLNAQLLGLYGIDCFLGSTLQIDRYGNSSTAIKGMISGFGGAPNLGGSPPGRRHSSASWKKTSRENRAFFKSTGFKKGQKLVVQMTPTVSEKKGIPVFVDELDAVSLYKEGKFDSPPVMIYADNVTHIVTECGIANLLKCSGKKERAMAIEAVAGDTPVGKRAKAENTLRLRKKGIVSTCEDLGINPAEAKRSLLAARSLDDLVEISGGVYKIPDCFKKLRVKKNA